MAAEKQADDKNSNTSETPKGNTTICPRHQLAIPLKRVGTPPFQHVYAVCPECAREDEAEEQRKQKDLQDKHDEWIKAGIEERLFKGVPPRFRDAKLEDFQKIEKIIDWMRYPKDFLLILGPCGTGKSRLANAMAIEFRRREITTEVICSSDLFLSLRRSFNRLKTDDPTEFQIIDSLAQPTIAIFDDIGAQKQSEYVIEAWYNVIDLRYRNCKATVFTSNLAVKEISAGMSDRVASRLLSGTVVTLTGRDRRVS